jgi:hypothetical protein
MIGSSERVLQSARRAVRVLQFQASIAKLARLGTTTMQHPCTALCWDLRLLTTTYREHNLMHAKIVIHV